MFAELHRECLETTINIYSKKVNSRINILAPACKLNAWRFTVPFFQANAHADFLTKWAADRKFFVVFLLIIYLFSC